MGACQIFLDFNEKQYYQIEWHILKRKSMPKSALWHFMQYIESCPRNLAVKMHSLENKNAPAYNFYWDSI